MDASTDPAVAGAANRLSALSVGLHVPWHACGKVHSIFERAANVELPGQHLVVLLDATCANVAHGVRLPTDTWRTLRQSLKVAQPVWFDRRGVRFARTGQTVDLAYAQRWSADLRGARIDTRDPAVIGAFIAASAACSQAWQQDADCLVAAYRRRLSEILFKLKAAIHARAASIVAHQLRSLIGLGPGLTPSGDDFVVGLLAGLAIGADHQTWRTRFLSAITDELDLSTTTLVSRQLLFDACHQQFAQPLAELALAIASGSADVPTKLHAALAIGAHSGADGVAGLLFGMRVCSPALPQTHFAHPTKASRQREIQPNL